MPSTELIQAVAVTAELCGRTFSEGAARVFVDDLSRYPEAAVIGALGRCRREVKGVLTVSDVVSRLEDGRPGVEEAWGLLPISESQTCVWTDEMSAAFGSALPLIERRDMVGARMAFKEAYAKALAKARDSGKPPNWWASIGTDRAARKSVLEAAVNDGRLTLDYARQHVPELTGPANPQLERSIAAALAAPERRAA
ncbi:MAG: hypothetical protein H0X13_19855 [Ramlibacter sp.]|nr:hypothetical protein [Ramlibacter sp.]